MRKKLCNVVESLMVRQVVGWKCICFRCWGGKGKEKLEREERNGSIYMKVTIEMNTIPWGINCSVV